MLFVYAFHYLLVSGWSLKIIIVTMAEKLEGGVYVSSKQYFVEGR